MGIFDWLFGGTQKLRAEDAQTVTADAEPRSPPTVKFDDSQVTPEVLADLRSNIDAIADIPAEDRNAVYRAAVQSVTRGRDLGVLAKAIIALEIDGVGKRRSGEISRNLNNKASSLMDVARCERLGIKYATWMYSGAPCNGHARQDFSHKTANGKRFEVSKGLAIGKTRSWPGREDGCKCSMAPVINDFR